MERACAVATMKTSPAWGLVFPGEGNFGTFGYSQVLARICLKGAACPNVRGRLRVAARGTRERIAIGFLAAAVVLAAVLGVMTIRSYAQPSSTVAASQGDVSGQQAATSP